jgi:hypothetical protein
MSRVRAIENLWLLFTACHIIGERLDRVFCIVADSYTNWYAKIVTSLG